MKKKYHIKIKETKEHQVKDALKLIGVIPEKVDADSSIRNYIVSLSKYELLFLRCACSSGEFVKL